MYNHNVQVGDLITVLRTGRAKRKVMEVHDSYLMVERVKDNYKYKPYKTKYAKIYYSQIVYNHSQQKRDLIKIEFEDNIEEFKNILNSLIHL